MMRGNPAQTKQAKARTIRTSEHYYLLLEREKQRERERQYENGSKHKNPVMLLSKEQAREQQQQ
jgi:hypothetical protein